MKILVTGASGLIGRHLCPLLADAGHSVHALVLPGSIAPELEHDRINRFPGDVTVPESLAVAVQSCDAVVHAAGIKAAGRNRTFQRVNIEGTRHLADAAAQAGVKRLIYISSIAAQGPSTPGRPHGTPGTEQPHGAYGESKLAAERLLHDHPVGPFTTVLRPGITYGPHDKEMLTWVRLARRRVLPIRPQFELSFIHVYDLVELIAQLIPTESPSFGPYFVSDGHVRTMEEVVDIIERTLSTGPTVRLFLNDSMIGRVATTLRRITEASGILSGVSKVVGDLETASWACEPTQAREAFSFTPKVQLRQGLADTIRWYERTGKL